MRAIVFYMQKEYLNACKLLMQLRKKDKNLWYQRNCAVGIAAYRFYNADQTTNKSRKIMSDTMMPFRVNRNVLPSAIT